MRVGSSLFLMEKIVARTRFILLSPFRACGHAILCYPGSARIDRRRVAAANVGCWCDRVHRWHGPSATAAATAAAAAAKLAAVPNAAAVPAAGGAAAGKSPGAAAALSAPAPTPLRFASSSKGAGGHHHYHHHPHTGRDSFDIIFRDLPWREFLDSPAGLVFRADALTNQRHGPLS